jgi:hypothetical protein
MAEAVARRDFDLSELNLLPRLTANGSVVTRSNREASSSESIRTGTQSLEPSTSTDKTRAYGDLTFSWHVLDFGVSYFEAQQQSDRLLIAEQRRRKARLRNRKSGNSKA